MTTAEFVAQILVQLTTDKVVTRKVTFARMDEVACVLRAEGLIVSSVKMEGYFQCSIKKGGQIASVLKPRKHNDKWMFFSTIKGAQDHAQSLRQLNVRCYVHKCQNGKFGVVLAD